MAKGLDEEIAGLMSAAGLIGGEVEPKPLQEEIRFYKRPPSASGKPRKRVGIHPGLRGSR